jgi:hypothetical protein
MEPYVEPWRPGIGDPTVMGWATVVAYFAAATTCVFARRRSRGSSKGWVWPALAVALVVLGFNKQLDLQSWFTYVGKRTAIEQGWYDDRRSVQIGFIVVLAAIGLSSAVVLLHRLRGALDRFRWALVGAVLLIAFIVIRAASFHHVDLFLTLEIGGVRPNWVLELGGIGLIAFGALRDAGTLERMRRPERGRRRRPESRKRAAEMGWLDILREIHRRGSAREREVTARPIGAGGRRRESTRPAGRRDGFRVVVTGPPRRHATR